ncbi:transcriptional regulator, TetR family [Fontimonas thermophila]|uniref:Transcriptional regulator, TetR family n=1 Tax=Fontimonas thermophila TaxID=1076937 RepID=A0A1I2HCD5_9GAMM|nr:TetR/AcrR family transcriptional regulator [Fontimonas thermophila]SFF27209.1 transcriptional regulator, TetR family [Fontimonas thermophila]
MNLASNPNQVQNPRSFRAVGCVAVGTKERRQRQFAEREQLFLDTARELIRESGLLNLQMSRIAEKCEYAVGTLYQHFASKEDLLLALTTLQAQEHTELFRRVRDWNASARDRMIAIGVADLIFVRRHPDHFRIAQYALCEVVWRAASPDRRAEFLEACQPVARIVADIVRDAVAAGDLVLGRLTPEQLCTGLWALCNGTHNLVHAEGVLEEFAGHDAYRLMFRHMHAMLNGFNWKPLVDVTDDRTIDRLNERIRNEVFHDLCSAA